jgi:hypothetical protein
MTDDVEFEPEEDGEQEYAYVFIPRADLEHGVYADRFMDVTPTVGRSYKEFLEIIAVYRQMGMDKENMDQLTEMVSALQSIKMRALITGQDVCLVKTTVPMTPERMDAFLQSKQREGKLTEFTRQARVAL